MLTKQRKEELVDELAIDVKKAKGLYLAHATGIDSNSMNGLRKTCREAGVRYMTSKNTLTKRAFGKAGISSFDNDLVGPISLVLSFEDGVAPAKILTDFQKGNKEKFVVKGCYVDGAVLLASDVERLAALPSRDVLLSQLLSVLNAPARNLACALSGILRNVAGVVDAVARKKAEEGDTSKADEGDAKKAEEGGVKKAEEGDAKKAEEGDAKKAEEGDAKKAEEGDAKKAEEGDAKKA